MTARIFWVFGAGLSALAMLLMVTGGPEMAGLLDYRAWLLLASGILALAIGSFSRTLGSGN